MPPLSHLKLSRLAELEGFRTKEGLLHTYIRETVVPGICMRPDCEGVASVDRHERAGRCDTCGHDTIQSCLVIAGLLI